MNRKVDDDYCVDDLCFSEPLPLLHLRGETRSGILTSGGDRLMGSLQIQEKDVRVKLSGFETEISVPMSDIRSIQFGNPSQKVGKGQRVWHAMLRDRSIVAVNPLEKFQSSWFEKKTVDPTAISALWLASNEMRFPLADDFGSELGQQGGNSASPAVIVYPTCRILASDLTISPTEYVWSEVEKREQELWIQNSDSEREEFGPEEKMIRFNDTSAEQIPTLWLKTPPRWEAQSGLIRLIDGQQFVIDGTEGIALLGFDGETVTIQWDRTTERLPFSMIESIDLPVR